MIDEENVGIEVAIHRPAVEVAAALGPSCGAPDARRVWYEGLRLHRYEERGTEGARFVVTGRLIGTCEWWIETLPARPDDAEPGVVVHFWLRGRATRDGDRDPARQGRGLLGRAARRRTRLMVQHHAERFRHLLHQIASGSISP